MGSMSIVLKPLWMSAYNYIDNADDQEIDQLIEYVQQCINYIKGEGHDGTDPQ